MCRQGLTHTWTDDGYNFDPGQVFHRESQVLERHGKAKPFKWQAVWADALEGELERDTRDTNLAPLGQSVLRWTKCKIRPAT